MVTPGGPTGDASTRDEVPLEVIAHLRERAPLLAADVQAFVRVIAADGTLVYESWPERAAVLSKIDVLKADTREAELVTGERELEVQARAIGDYQRDIAGHKRQIGVGGIDEFQE